MQSPKVMNRAEVQNTHSSMTNVKLMQLIKWSITVVNLFIIINGVVNGWLIVYQTDWMQMFTLNN